MKGFDKVGRIVIPMELRRKHGLLEGVPIEFVDGVDGVTVKAAAPRCKLCGAGIPEDAKLSLCDECTLQVVKGYYE